MLLQSSVLVQSFRLYSRKAVNLSAGNPEVLDEVLEHVEGKGIKEIVVQMCEGKEKRTKKSVEFEPPWIRAATDTQVTQASGTTGYCGAH